jgi:oligopeptidase A
MELIEMLRGRSFAAARKDIDDLKNFAEQQGCGYAGNLALWDVAFWSERLRENKYQYSDEEIRPYFALNAVLNSLFSLSSRLFGIVVEAADGQTEVWHSDVRFFKVSTTDAYVGCVLKSDVVTD